MKKRFLAMFMFVVMVISAIPFSASAATSATAPMKSNYTWSQYVNCKLSNRFKDGTVRVSIDNWGENIDIQMLKGNKVVWSQNNTIKSINKNVAYVYRDYSLGKNQSSYNLQFRYNKSKHVSMGGVYVSAVKNVKSVSIA
ncbi:MAG: hypothetical protein NC213_09380 [Acetobacter sp.]|nr:hypothetical protein [Bacteroides sp.]MCM1341942.1 hypothetical protein [Acetobacter sp.]MCM1434126.1 hypothetical protein [Clostridiales bacterium]